jgi:hypothetical protein
MPPSNPTQNHLPYNRRARIFCAIPSMMNLLLLAGLLASSLAMVFVVIRTARRRPPLDSNLSTEHLGTVSQQWLTAHRAEK